MFLKRWNFYFLFFRRQIFKINILLFRLNCNFFIAFFVFDHRNNRIDGGQYKVVCRFVNMPEISGLVVWLKQKNCKIIHVYSDSFPELNSIIWKLISPIVYYCYFRCLFFFVGSVSDIRRKYCRQMSDSNPTNVGLLSDEKIFAMEELIYSHRWSCFM